VDIRSDIYSLGCVLYHTLTGQPPFPESNVVTQMIRHATEPPKPLKELNPAIPDGLQQIVNWMLAKDPAQRYPTPGRAAQALQVFLVAGNEAPAIEQDPKMRSYLTWVEAEGSDKAKQELPKVSAQAVPIVAPKEGRAPRRARFPKAAVENKAATFEFDVELVAVPMPTAIPAGKPPRNLSRRDFVAFGLGAGSVLLAILLGWLMAVLLRQKPPADE
jgi:serine/threonine protein kinase